MLYAVENYLKLMDNDSHISFRTARRNGSYVAKLSGKRPTTSNSTAEVAQFRDWCVDKDVGLHPVTRILASVGYVINLNIREYGVDSGNAFSDAASDVIQSYNNIIALHHTFIRNCKRILVILIAQYLYLTSFKYRCPSSFLTTIIVRNLLSS